MQHRFLHPAVTEIQQAANMEHGDAHHAYLKPAIQTIQLCKENDDEDAQARLTARMTFCPICCEYFFLTMLQKHSYF